MTPIHLPVFRPSTAGMLDAIAEVLEVGWLGMGPATLDFERHLAEVLGVDPVTVVCTGTGTAALHTALACAGVGPGDEVILPALNFVADAQAIVACGASVVLADVLDESLNIDLASCRNLVGERTRAIMPLHYAGWPCDRGELAGFAAEFGLRVVEDATHALGSSHPDGTPVGGCGDLVCFSFDPVKVITSLDGGAVVARSAADADLARRYRDLGISRGSYQRHARGAPWSYQVAGPGLRYHLNSVSAAVGVSQVRQLGGFVADRQQACHRYVERLSDIAQVRLAGKDFSSIAPFIFYVRVPAEDRDELRAALHAAGIGTGLHFPPVHSFTAFRDCRRGDLAVTDRAFAELITLPLFVGITDDEIDLVTGVIRSYYGVS